jgi:hypothetical protein
MPKILCLVSLIVSGIIFLVFLLNLVAGVPFGSASGTGIAALGMLFASAVIGTFSVLTFLEER